MARYPRLVSIDEVVVEPARIVLGDKDKKISNGHINRCGAACWSIEVVGGDEVVKLTRVVPLVGEGWWYP